jgi:hypothetical protein
MLSDSRLRASNAGWQYCFDNRRELEQYDRCNGVDRSEGPFIHLVAGARLLEKVHLYAEPFPLVA